jgi:hypothetical protein
MRGGDAVGWHPVGSGTDVGGCAGDGNSAGHVEHDAELEKSSASPDASPSQHSPASLSLPFAAYATLACRRGCSSFGGNVKGGCGALWCEALAGEEASVGAKLVVVVFARRRIDGRREPRGVASWLLSAVGVLAWIDVGMGGEEK